MSGIVMRILISITISKFLHKLCRCVPQMQWYRHVSGFPNYFEGFVYSKICRIALLACREIHHTFCKRNPSFRPSYFLYDIKSGICKQESIRVCKSYILGSTYDKSPCNELWVFPTLYHSRHPIECGIRVAATYALYESRDDVIVHITVLVIGKWVLL